MTRRPSRVDRKRSASKDNACLFSTANRENTPDVNNLFVNIKAKVLYNTNLNIITRKRSAESGYIRVSFIKGKVFSMP